MIWFLIAILCTGVLGVVLGHEGFTLHHWQSHVILIVWTVNCWAMQTIGEMGKTGVCWHKATGKWMASIRAQGRPIYLGVFDEFEDAVAARLEAELKYYGRNKE